MPTKLPRINVTVSEEQHGLLLELAALNGGSAAGYLRLMLDQATPLLRATVPALRMAAEEMDATKQEAGAQLRNMLEAIAQVGVDVPPDLFDQADRAMGVPVREKHPPRSVQARPAHAVPARRK